MKNINKAHKIHNKVFDFHVYWVDGDREFLNSWLLKQGLELSNKNATRKIQGITIHEHIDILYFESKLDYVILHECIHMIQHILETDVGVDTSYSNTEVLAYNVDWLYREILCRYHKARGNDKYKTYLT